MKRFLCMGLSLIMTLLTATSSLFAAAGMEEESFFADIPQVISASKVSEKISDAPGVISVVTQDDLKRFGGTTLADILSRVPSLAHSSNYFSERSMIAIRGAQFKENSSHMLLLINSRPLRDGLEGGIAGEVLESFPVNVIDHIEVIRGPGSVLYGSNAFDGVINVITKKAEQDGVTSTVSALAGEKGASDTSAMTRVKKGDFSMVLAGKFHEKPDWSTQLEFLRQGTLLQSHAEIGNRGPGFYGEMSYKNLKLMTGYTHWQSLEFQPSFSNTLASPRPDFFGTVWWTKRWADLGYTQKINDVWRMEFNATYVNSLLDTVSFPYARRSPYQVTGEWANFFTPSDRMKVVAGGAFNYIKAEVHNNNMEADLNPSKNIVGNDHVLRGFDAYSQLDYWMVPEKTKGIAGLQFNEDQGVPLNIVPRAGLIQYLSPEVNIKALYSRAYRAPSGNERFRVPSVLEGKADLKPENGDTYDLGVNYATNRVQTGLNMFYSRQSNDIRIVVGGAPDSTPSSLKNQYQNTARIEARGVEWEGKVHASKQLLLTASALYQSNHGDNGGKNVSPLGSGSGSNVSPIANASGKLGISYAADKGLTVSVFDQYQGKLDRKYASAQNPSPGDYNLLDLNARLDLDKFTGHSFAKGLALLFRVDDALDRQVWLPNWAENSPQTTSTPFIQGRTIYGGFELSF